MKISKKKLRSLLLSLIILVVLTPISYYLNSKKNVNVNVYNVKIDIPEYNNSDIITINNNEPNFNEQELNINNKEQYSDLDILNRCGPAFAVISTNSMPTKEREAIGQIKPTGWHTVKYDIIEDKYLYNRCHLIGYQLTGQNANPKNLITCTRYMNSISMLEYENKVANYIKKTNNHVAYKVTPVFKDNNLLATGVEMQAYSIEDNGEGIKFNIFVYNVQPGISIDYLTGDSNLK